MVLIEFPYTRGKAKRAVCEVARSGAFVFDFPPVQEDTDENTNGDFRRFKNPFFNGISP